MKTAAIMMTILGCDDSVSQCHYIDTADQKWVSIELCHAASEQVLEGYSGASYPMVIAVCQPPENAGNEAATAPKTAEAPPADTAKPPVEQQESLTARAVAKIRGVLPGTERIKMVFEKPLHVVADSYSWVAKKLTP
ncbi:hypothetical protein [Ciceribacter sp. RN22]|uniref:hypothetical protein n=1 Tax=Ciceribacter sp. RN22 TaxID=2954932 RepID=UPI0020920771|nr:hypothetical protein [Ciceribacter sp. RN22]MCO6178207.1 hypothetical protein [Ciceribacter sp. RN22]